MKIFKYLLFISITGFIFFIFTGESFAAADQAAATYKATVQRMELKNDAGNWVTIATPNKEIDIAAVGAGAVAGSFLNDASIPIGNYVNFRLTISETMKVAGHDGTNYTNAGGSAVLTGSAATSADLFGLITAFSGASTTLSTTAEGEMSIQINLDSGDADDYIQIYKTTDLTTPISIKVNSTVSLWADFDTQDTVHYVAAGGFGPGIPATNAMYFTPPGTGTQMSITVDGVTTTVTEAQMTMAF